VINGISNAKIRHRGRGCAYENGEAIEEIKVKTGRSYSVRIGKLDNICYHNELDQYFDSPYDVEGTFTYKFAECSYLKLKIENVNCQGENDDFKLYHINSDVGYLSYDTPIKVGGVL
jgi:hypothetical protein